MKTFNKKNAKQTKSSTSGWFKVKGYKDNVLYQYVKEGVRKILIISPTVSSTLQTEVDQLDNPITKGEEIEKVLITYFSNKLNLDRKYFEYINYTDTLYCEGNIIYRQGRIYENIV